MTSRFEQGGWRAEFDQPTHRYGHGIMGDLPEWGRLCLSHRNGRGGCVTLPQSRVFEDMAPRLAYFDGIYDDLPEMVVVESDRDRGAALVVYRLDGRTLRRIATPYIGQSNRWLAPAGVADLDGDGAMEVAYIDRPHLARTLRIWRFEGDRLTEVATARGLTNHRIGETFISGGIRRCDDRLEIITADAKWQRIMATTFDGQNTTSKSLGAFSPEALARVMDCKD